MRLAEGFCKPNRGRRTGVNQEDAVDCCTVLRHHRRAHRRYVVPDELERQALTRSRITIDCGIVEAENLVCIINFNYTVAEYIGAEESIRTSAHFAREPFQGQRRHSLISQRFS